MNAGRHRQVVVTWLAVYPLATLITLALEPLLGGAPAPLRTLALSVVLVPTMVYAALPCLQRVLSGWTRH